MNNFGYDTMTLGTTTESCACNNSVVDEELQREMMNAETEDQVLELSIERLYQSLKDSIKL